MRASVRLFTTSNMNISETSGPIAIKFNLKHHIGRGNAALGFGPDRIKLHENFPWQQIGPIGL